MPTTPTMTVTGTPATGITLTSSAATGNRFYLNGTAVGATGQTYLTSSGARNGSYTVVTMGAGACASAAVTVTVTATNSAQAVTALTLYPNPTLTGQLAVELSGYHEAAQLTISNALGQRIYATTIALAALARPQGCMCRKPARPAGGRGTPVRARMTWLSLIL